MTGGTQLPDAPSGTRAARRLSLSRRSTVRTVCSSMRAVDDADLRLYLVDPSTVLAEYAPILTDDQAESLALASADDALVLVVAHPSTEGVSVNLMAPVIVNRTTGAASQVILEDQATTRSALRWAEARAAGTPGRSHSATTATLET